MKQQNNFHVVRKNKPIIALLMSWLTIVITYMALRIVFLMFGLHLYKTALGACLAVIPYFLGIVYLKKSKTSSRVSFYVLGIVPPAIVEKILLYFLGACLYGINPIHISEVLKKIAADEPFTNILSMPSLHYALNFSFFGWLYIVSSLAVCAVLILFAAGINKQ